MEDNLKSVSTDLFYKIRSRFSGLKLGKETGEVTINPEEAVFFDFDYMEGENPVGHVSVSIAEPSNMKVYYSNGITEQMDNVQRTNWYEFLRGLREFAKRRLMSFDTRDISKDNLDKRDYAFLTQYSSPVGESIMKEGMYGSTKTSYQKLENTTLIIKHSQKVDETSPGSRTRHISAMFVENGDGERFKYPFIHLAGARAMQRHVQEGGLPYDEIGRHIISMSEQIAQLKNFGNYVVRNDLMNSDTNNIVERTGQALNRLREEIKKLAGKNYYYNFKESFQTQVQEEVPQDVIEDLTNKFTVKNFKEDIKSVFPVIYNLMKEGDNGLGYDDIVAMTQETVEEQQQDLDTTYTVENDFSNFESWIMNLGEESAIQSNDPDEKSAAIDELQKLVGEHFPAGIDGQNAINSLKGIIDDPELARDIKNAAKEDADTCVRPLVYQWLEDNAPDTLEQLDFGDMDMPADDGSDQGGETDDGYALASAGFGSDEDYGYASDEYEEGFGDALKRGFRKAANAILPGVEKDAGDNPSWNKDTSETRNNFINWITMQELDHYEDELLGYFDKFVQGGGSEYKAGEQAVNTWKARMKRDGESVRKPESEASDPNHPEYDKADDYDLSPAQRGKGTDKYRLPDPKKHDDRHARDFRKRSGQQTEELNINELAQFIGSFYDKQNEEFPKGATGVITMVGKKYGDKAAMLAQEMIGRLDQRKMLGDQMVQNPPANDELARIRSLSGL